MKLEATLSGALWSALAASLLVTTGVTNIGCSGNGPRGSGADDTGRDGEARGAAGDVGAVSAGGSGGPQGGAAPSGGAGGSRASGGQGGSSGHPGGATGGGGTATGSGGVTAAAGGHQGEGGAPSDSCDGVADSCPMDTGLTHACKKRFALGLNYAWKNYATDFGGLAQWQQKGVSENPDPYDADLGAMHAAGASAIRWWVFPDFRGDGIRFDTNGSGDPVGLSATVGADVNKALELARKNDVYLVLTVFSFDNFRPDDGSSGRLVRGMSPLVSDAARRKKLIDNVVRPLAHAAGTSPDHQRLLGWDAINEPEWAVKSTGSAPGGQDFTPNGELTSVSLADMKSFIGEVLAVLKQETPGSLTSVGWAAAKWAWAFSDVPVDFNQPHIYAWVDQYWPYTKTPAQIGYTSRPTVMGEFYLQSMPFADGDNATIDQILGSWWDNGYSGAWAWQYNEKPGSTLIKGFKTAKGCPAGF